MKVAFVVNGGPSSAMAERANSLASRLRPAYDIEIAYRGKDKIRSIGEFVSFLKRSAPDLTYVFDFGFSGMLAAAWHRLLHGGLLVADTGDAMYELMRTSGGRGPLGLLFTRALEEFSLRVADQVIVRGDFHREMLAARNIQAEVITDGVDCAGFQQPNRAANSEASRQLRTRLGLDGFLSVGVVGSSLWSERQQMCYGWDLVELLRLLPDLPVKGVMIGDGDGIDRLKSKCDEYGIAGRLLFLGRVPYEELHTHLSVMDVCLSTQTNNIAGQVRTTGKLPVYLASGRYILASRVGQAVRVLPPEMLVDYEGEKDEAYPARLAERIRVVLNEPSRLAAAAQSGPAIALEQFDYSVLAARLDRVLQNAGAGGLKKGVNVARSS